MKAPEFQGLLLLGGYYVDDSHPGIIQKDMWEAVQLEAERRSAFAKRHGITRQDYSSDSNSVAGKVICGDCGGLFCRKVWNSTNKNLRRIIWQCNHKYEEKGKVQCHNRHVDEELLNESVAIAFDHIRDNPESYLRKWDRDIRNISPLVNYQARQMLKIYNTTDIRMGLDNNINLNSTESIWIRLETLEVKLIDGTKIEV
jgi:hypothetical protein